MSSIPLMWLDRLGDTDGREPTGIPGRVRAFRDRMEAMECPEEGERMANGEPMRGT